MTTVDLPELNLPQHPGWGNHTSNVPVTTALVCAMPFVLAVNSHLFCASPDLCNAAMLTVEDPAFWEGVEPVKFGVLPRLQDSVTVIGYDLVPPPAFLLPAHIATTYAVTSASHRFTPALHREFVCTMRVDICLTQV